MLIFLDLETTGLESSDVIVSCGLVCDGGKELYSLVNEGKKIPAIASSIHHITNEMVKKAPRFLDSKICDFLQEYNSEENTLVGHNIKFDIEFLNRAGLAWKGGIIDTLKVTKHLIPECEFFSLQILRYELKLYKQEQENLKAHNALDDAKLVKLLYDYLLELADTEKMKELSFQNVLLQKLEFGKYKGSYIEEIAFNDRAYLEWMLGNIIDLDEDLRYSIIYYLEGRV